MGFFSKAIQALFVFNLIVIELKHFLLSEMFCIYFVIDLFFVNIGQTAPQSGCVAKYSSAAQLGVITLRPF